MKEKIIIIFAIFLLIIAGSALSAVGQDVGDIITFGNFEQDEQLGADPIEWQVLAVEDDRALLISLYALEARPYHYTFDNVTWETCELRTWLNEQFYFKAFNTAEKAQILDVRNINADNPVYETDGGNETEDCIFLLSMDEAEKYLPTEASRQCKVTYHAKQNGAFESFYDANSWWWLRSPGYANFSAMIIGDDGDISVSGFDVDNKGTDTVVRPALWISLKNDIISEDQ